MTMEEIRLKYGVPAKRGMEVGVGNGLRSIIVGSDGFYLRIRVYDRWGICTYHPTWYIAYSDKYINTEDSDSV